MGRSVYDSDSVLYLNDHERKFAALNILRESIRIFKESYKIQKIKILENELVKNTQNVYLYEFSQEELLDNIRIIICFENYMKSVLILSGYIVHITVSKENTKFKPLKNRNRPTKVTELIQIEDYYYDHKKEYYRLRGINKRTIGFSDMVKSNYQDIIRLPKDILDILLYINESRNYLHFLQDGVKYNRKKISDLKKLIDFVNGEVIRKYNDLVVEVDLPQSWKHEYIHI